MDQSSATAETTATVGTAATADPAAPAVASASDLPAPALAAGVRLLGEYQGSGFTEPHYLIVREDDQVLHVSRLLFLVASAVDGTRSRSEVAAHVSAEYGKTLTEDGLTFLLDEKLRPMGVVTAGMPVTQPGSSRHAAGGPTHTEATPAPTAKPLLALRFRGTLLPARATRALAGLLAPMFFAPTVVLAVVSLVGVDIWLARSTSLGGALGSVLVDPPLLLAVIGLLLISTILHELGHAAACRAGGATPGVIGVAVYVVYPAFFTDVTDSYRLGRAGRVRTDLGGVYFNALSIIALALVYAETGAPAVLLAIVFVHVEMLQQLLPIGRLDGYFIVADLVGIPDLFSRIGPILLSLVPGRPQHPKVVELRRSARVVVTVWVLTVVPVMALLLGVMLWSTPSLTRQTLASLVMQADALRTAASTGDVAGLALAALSLVLLPLPLLGLTWLVVGSLRRLVGLVVRRSRRRTTPAPSAPTSIPKERTMSASQAGLRTGTVAPPSRPGPAPDAATAGAPRAPSGAHEHPATAPASPPLSRPRGRRGRQRYTERLLSQVGTRFDGSRRIAVLSRKGGVGKTTTTLMLGHTLATHRGDRVVALDANPDAGSLGMRLHRETSFSATDLLAERAWVQRYSQIRTYTSQDPRTGLEVVASDDDPRITSALNREDYAHLIDILDRHFTLLLVDTGTGVLDDAIQGVLEEADQLVIVVPPATDGARVAGMTLDWLDAHGYEGLSAGSVAVVNGVCGPVDDDLRRIEEPFRRRCSSVHRVPWDATLATHAQASLTDLRPATQLAYLEIAAALGVAFPTTSRTLYGLGA